jgi:hypothetical protein
MSRVSSAEVLAIMDLGSGVTDVDAFIAGATLVVTERLGEKGLSDDLLKEIERWLSAHFVSINLPKIMEEKIGGASQKYEGIVFIGSKKGLDTTRYGQQVLVLDSTGTMSNIGKVAASISVPDFREAP